VRGLDGFAPAQENPTRRLDHLAAPLGVLEVERGRGVRNGMGAARSGPARRRVRLLQVPKKTGASERERPDAAAARHETTAR